MMKKIPGILVIVVLVGYLAFSLHSLTDRPEGTLCEGIDLRIQDSLHYGLLDEVKIMRLLERNGLNPIGQPIESLDLDSIEHVLMRHPLVLSAECYRTVGNTLKIRLHSCVPLVRVILENGSDYIVDSRGRILERSGSVLNLPVATGHISRDFARNELVEAVRTINESDFWKSQVEQIYVDELKQINIVPRVGNHLLRLGSTDNLENKLDRLKEFCIEGLNTIGWNKYSSVSVAFDGQIVCKRR